MEGDGRIDVDTVEAALRILNVDEHGLDEIDLRLLAAIIDRFHGGPVGLNNLAAVVGEEAETLEEVYEPYLIKEGFIRRTPRGRQAMERAYLHLGRDPRALQSPQLGLL